MMGIWILDLYYHKILQTFALNFSKNTEWFEKPYNQKLKRVFHQVSKHLKVHLKNSALPLFFQPTSWHLDILMKHTKVLCC